MVFGVLGTRTVFIRCCRRYWHRQPRHDLCHRHAKLKERREGAAKSDDGFAEWECGDWDDESNNKITGVWYASNKRFQFNNPSFPLWSND
jgi:hypothetical protein